MLKFAKQLKGDLQMTDDWITEEEKVVTSISIPKEFHSELKEFSESLGLPMSEVIVRYLKIAFNVEQSGVPNDLAEVTASNTKMERYLKKIVDEQENVKRIADERREALRKMAEKHDKQRVKELAEKDKLRKMQKRFILKNKATGIKLEDGELGRETLISPEHKYWPIVCNGIRLELEELLSDDSLDWKQIEKRKDIFEGKSQMGGILTKSFKKEKEVEKNEK